MNKSKLIKTQKKANDFFNSVRFKALRKASSVKVRSGQYKGKVYKIEKILKSSKVVLKDLYALNSNKKIYQIRMEESKLKIEN